MIKITKLKTILYDTSLLLLKANLAIKTVYETLKNRKIIYLKSLYDKKK